VTPLVAETPTTHSILTAIVLKSKRIFFLMLILSWQKGLRVWSLEVENKKKA